MLMTLYAFTVMPAKNRPGVHTLLTRLEDGKKILFFKACEPNAQALKNLTDHMETLTDDQCWHFFNPHKKRKGNANV